MKFNWQNIKKPILGLAPMADMTDSAFCQIIKSLANPVIWREMVSAEAIVRGNDKTWQMAKIHSTERPLIQQIFGSDPERMAEAARLIEEKSQPEGIDINMGCPVYKMTTNFNGAALMKDPDLASQIVSTVKKAISIPLSVKLRAGWSEHTECIDFAKRLELAGADLISIHGRTKAQGYAGKANRQVVAQAKDSVTIPVLYNGDILTWQDFFSALDETGCNGALIARGALGNPWIFAQIETQLKKEEIEQIDLQERIRVVRHHLKLHLELYGPEAVPTFRKHLSWYFKGLPHFKKFKQAMMTETDRQKLDKIFDQVLDEAVSS